MSRPQVTITLGRSGQVVKRAGNTLNESRFDPTPLSGTKRSIRERLGGNSENFLSGSQSNPKRYRREISGSSNDVQDLRMKLMQKNKPKQLKNVSIGNLKNMSLHGNASAENHSTLYAKQPMREAARESSLQRIPPSRSADDLLQLNLGRKSNSSWNGERLGSPDRIVGPSREFSLGYGSPGRRVRVSRGHSPPELLNVQRQALRPVEVSRVSLYAGKDIYNHTRPLATRTTMSQEAMRYVPRQHPQSSVLQNSSYLEPLTIGHFLNSLGLGKYAIIFQAEEIDFTVLRHMQDNDLKELGIPMGPRRKILLSLLSLSKQRT